MPRVWSAALMSTTAVPEGSRVTSGKVNLFPLLRYRMGVTVTAEISITFLRYNEDFKLGPVIQSPPASELCLAGGNGCCCDLGTSGGIGLCGASTLGC